MLRRKDVEADVVNVRNAKVLRRRSVLTKLLKKQKNFLVLHRHLSNSNVPYIRRSKVGSQNIGEHDVLLDVQYAFSNKANARVLIERSRVSQ